MDSWNEFCLLGRENNQGQSVACPRALLCPQWLATKTLWPNTKKYNNPIHLTTTFWWSHRDSQGRQCKSSSLEKPFRACVTGIAHPLWFLIEVKQVHYCLSVRDCLFWTHHLFYHLMLPEPHEGGIVIIMSLVKQRKSKAQKKCSSDSSWVGKIRCGADTFGTPGCHLWCWCPMM